MRRLMAHPPAATERSAHPSHRKAKGRWLLTLFRRPEEQNAIAKDDPARTAPAHPMSRRLLFLLILLWPILALMLLG